MRSIAVLEEAAEDIENGRDFYDLSRGWRGIVIYPAIAY